MNRIVLCLALLSLSSASARAASEADLLPVDQAYPISIDAVRTDSVRIRWGIADGYYLYKHRTAIESDNPEVTLEPLQLPAGKPYRDEFFGDVETYRKELVTTVRFSAPDGTGHLLLRLQYQGCADIGICYPPQNKRLRIPLTTTDTDGMAVLGLDAADDSTLREQDAFRVEAIVGDAGSLLLKLTPAEGYYLYRDKIAFSTSQDAIAELGKAKLPEAVWYPDPEFGTVPVYFEPAEIVLPLQRKRTKAGTLQLTVNYQGCKENGICYPPMKKTLTLGLPAGSTVSDAGAVDTKAPAMLLQWLPALLLALLGGLILNLMPCVLPVLSFKAMALAKANTPGHARSHALWYTSGVMSSFAALGIGVLALRSAGQAMGWGFQLQQPIIVGGLALLMFGIGLMMSGLFNWGSGFAGMGQSLTEKSGPTGDFFTGVLAVVVASPCTAPFMGSALAFAFTAHWLLALSVFLALGLGLALPFLLIGFLPGLAGRLPKPGAWMDTLKHWLAYPMYLTAVWLAWVFGNQKGVDGLALLLLAATMLAAALWWFERQKLNPNLRAKAIVLALGVLAAASFGAALQQAQPGATISTQGKNYEAFSPQRLAELRAQGTPVFVDMTADWCITCKVNEKAVLHTDAFTQLLREAGTVYLVGDWTNQDPAISAYLDQYDTPGVPLYVVYPNGPGEGKKLPQLLTLDIMRDALVP
ncbi:protein-disulfide reductase DsbD family protein [Arenimonas sp.]|uniref:protein-disulfide reductase DsbD family protein n=1 Tax=Arenimonas sp. TaxID=1872635 RepID=UPI0037C0898C